MPDLRVLQTFTYTSSMSTTTGPNVPMLVDHDRTLRGSRVSLRTAGPKCGESGCCKEAKSEKSHVRFRRGHGDRGLYGGTVDYTVIIYYRNTRRRFGVRVDTSIPFEI